MEIIIINKKLSSIPYFIIELEEKILIVLSDKYKF